MECHFSAYAESDLEEIGDYIARDNPQRALSFIGEIRKRCREIASFPKSAPLRPEFGKGIRSVPFGRYVIFYTLHRARVRIERILQGSRNLPEVYGE